MPAERCRLVWDITPDGPATENRAYYSSLEEAKAQAKHDIEHGRAILRIEDENGRLLWEPKAVKGAP